MISKASTAYDIYQENGAIPLAQETTLWLGERAPFGSNIFDSLAFRWSKKRVRERMATENNLADILDTVLEIHPGYAPYHISATQLRDEIEPLAREVKRINPDQGLEIGTNRGGTFYIWNRYIDSFDRVVSVDLPGGRFGGGYEEKMMEIYDAFSSKEKHFIRKNSHDEETYEDVAARFDGGVDFIFIDGDHTYQGVKEDFEMYRRLINEGGIIAFHDIVNIPDEEQEVERWREMDIDGLEERHLKHGKAHPDCNVDQLWEELIDEYETQEFISHPRQTWGGIGIVQF